MIISKEQAFELFTQGLENPLDIQYVTHCYYVGQLAGLIAQELGADSEHATVLGYLHDIGRRIDPADHAYAGYLYLKKNGYDEYADICLTHSFLNNDIECTAGIPFSKEHPAYNFIKGYIAEHKNTVYDRIIQTCDLLCLYCGGTTLEERLADIESRKGRYEHAQYHYDTAKNQMLAFEESLGYSVYTLYEKIESPVRNNNSTNKR